MPGCAGGDQLGLAARVRVFDTVRLVLTELLAGTGGLRLDGSRVGVVGHSFGGWTVLATPDQEPRVRAVVALAPGGASRPRLGIIAVGLDFAWGRDVPTLYLAGGEDVMTPLDGITELYQRTPATARMFVLRGADHLHFVDDVEAAHESLRLGTLPGDAAWIPAAMRPLAELCPPAQAHEAIRGLTLAHLDATLRDDLQAEALLRHASTNGIPPLGIETPVCRLTAIQTFRTVVLSERRATRGRSTIQDVERSAPGRARCGIRPGADRADDGLAAGPPLRSRSSPWRD